MTNIEYENKTSIIIPARNYDFLLDKTLKRIRELYKNIKIVLILDDIDSINCYLDSNIKVLKSNSKNMSAKRNQGVQATDCEFIALLDSDAYPQANWLETGIEFLDKNKDYSAVAGAWYNTEVDTFNQKCVRIQRFSPLFSRKEWWKIIDKSATQQDITEFTAANVLIRRKDYIEAGMMNELIYIAEDIEFSGRLTKLGYKMKFIPEFAVFHREAEIYSFIRKVYCCGYYYSNNIIRKHIKKDKNVYLSEDFLWHIYPLMFAIFYLILWTIFLYFKLSILPLIILTFLLSIPLILNALHSIKHLEEKKIKGFFIILFISISFCFAYVISSLLGILNIPSKDVQKMYKHY